MRKDDLKDFYNKKAISFYKATRQNRHYHRLLEKYFAFVIPPGSKVLEIGCGSGDLLEAVAPADGVGIDFSEKMIELARKHHPQLRFYVQDAGCLEISETFDYIILSDLVSSLDDIQLVIRNLKKVSHDRTKIILSFYSSLWEPVLKTAEFLRLKVKQPHQNWLSVSDIENMLELEDFNVVRVLRKTLLPVYIPLLSWFFNTILSNLPGFNSLCLINLLTARPVVQASKEYSVSIVIPARNEAGNIENAILRTPSFGLSLEFVFIEGNSSDNTYEEMLRVRRSYPQHNIVVARQSGRGKGNAVREGFELATGDILMILDADLTTPPEDLPKFYEALKRNKGEFINGCRLVYPMEKQAMRGLNLMANKFFGWFFSYLLNQRIKDTLCGTKVLYRSEYQKIRDNRHYFGDFDPFGDFDLLFGAARLNLKIVEICVRYKEREYGSTQIKRFSHGWLLLRMSLYAARKIKFI